MLSTLKRRVGALFVAGLLGGIALVSGHQSPSQHAFQTPYGVQAHSPSFGLPHGARPFAIAPQQPGVQTFEMYDSVDVGTVPSNPFATAGYTSGFWPTYLGLRQAFPLAHTVSIAVNTSHLADCLDIEPGDASPGEAAGWVRADLAAGFAHPCLYSSLSEMSAVRANLDANGIARSTVFLWDANWTYSPHLDFGYDATQWTDHSLGRNLDESTVSAAFLSIAQPPYLLTPPPPPWATPGCLKLSPFDTNFCFGQRYGQGTTDARWRVGILNYRLRQTGWLAPTEKTQFVDHADLLAVKAYQAKHHIPITGIVDHRTWQAIRQTDLECVRHHVRDSDAPYPGVGT